MISEDNDTLKSLALSHIIHISHGFESDIPEYRPEVTGKPGKLCHPMSKALRADILAGMVALEALRYMLCNIFFNKNDCD